MPQGRRKVPFSGKQKKQQLVAKRQSQKFFPNPHGYNPDNSDDTDDDGAGGGGTATGGGQIASVQKINYQSNDGGGGKGSQANRYALQFYKESDRQLRHMRTALCQPMVPRSAADLEVDGRFYDGYDFPTRPEWTYRMSKEQLNANENRSFTEYVMRLERQHADADKELSYFELNLETWRQLWRVLEISDIILVIVDIRYPTLMFPPALFAYVTETLRKSVILVLNKVDLAPPAVVLAWSKYFEQRYAGISIVLFTSFPGYNLRNVTGWSRGLLIRRRRGKQRMAVEGAKQVLDACARIVGDAVDMSSWSEKVAAETQWLEAKLQSSTKTGTKPSTAAEEHDDDEDDADDADDYKLRYDRVHADESAFDFEEHVRYKDGTLTVGCVGLPNVGKSSVLNALMGRKVVSVSKTPGHTKHFQTIYLTPNVRLCDCPGLVFPSAVPRALQVLLGSYPIAQLRVPAVGVQFLAERIDLWRLLDVVPGTEATAPYTVLDVCEAWALKRGFLTAKAARPDVSRAANSLLRMALEGQIALGMLPVGYGEEKEIWLHHPELKHVEDIQAFGRMETADANAAVENREAADSSGNSAEEEESDGEEGDDAHVKTPQVKNAFALLDSE